MPSMGVEKQQHTSYLQLSQKGDTTIHRFLEGAWHLAFLLQIKANAMVNAF